MKTDNSWRDHTTDSFDKVVENVLSENNSDVRCLYDITFGIDGIRLFLNNGETIINVNYLDFKNYL